MAVPFRRTSKTAKRKRRTHKKLEQPNLILCPQTHNFTLSHRVTRNSPYYKGKLFLRESKKENKENEK
ncbi:50S ribosomal protein L32 [Candidatus Phytoplasma phoenicium]|uniref:Large ribosomal subunit protein bL32 n=1 Tax=Candidatus Phytoplasma phoenicium TaxID=198422 RepID=A0A2S8NVD6_9MOLU|nr:50S ribosomal protein L32 [Candidatus Phytoplasma phoenicium]